MIPIKQYIAEQFLGNTYRFKCDCLLSLDIEGEVVDWSESGGEIILYVMYNGKSIPISLNHPNLKIERI